MVSCCGTRGRWCEMPHDAAGRRGVGPAGRGHGHREHGRRPLPHVPERRRSGCPARLGVRPDRWAWLTSTVAHWAYGCATAAGYGIVAGSLRRPRPRYGLPFGAAVWGLGYVVLPAGGLYKPIWEYAARTLARDLVAHLAYGAGTGAAFWALASVIRMAGSPAAHSA